MIPDPWILEVLDVVGVASVLDIYSSLDRALFEPATLLTQTGFRGSCLGCGGARPGHLWRPIPASITVACPAGWGA